MRYFYFFLVSLLAVAFSSFDAHGADGLPAAVQSVDIKEDTIPGMITLSWPAVTRDSNGLSLSQAVTYDVYAYKSAEQMTKVASGITDTSYTFQAYSGAEQMFVCYYVCAVNAAGTGEGAVSDTIPVGVPYKNFHATFADGKSKYAWGSGQLPDGVVIGLLTDKSGFSSQDGDNGFLAMQSANGDVSASIRSGKISLAGLANPVMIFYTYNFGSNLSPDKNGVSVKVRVPGETSFYEVYTNTVWEIAHNASGWGKATVDLSDYANETIQFDLGGTFITDGAFLFDNISLTEMPQNDIAMVGLTAPTSALAGTDIDVKVTVVNNGEEPAEEWKVVLKADGAEVAEMSGDTLDYGDSQEVILKYHISPLAEEAIELTAEAICEFDGDTSDNVTRESFKLTPALSQLPYVKKLSGGSNDTEVNLSWTAPDLTAAPRVFTEDFETGDPFSAEFGKWTFVDVDGQPSGGFHNIDIPNIVKGETTGSFWVWDSEAKVADSKGHSGTKFLFAMLRNDDGPVDDWAISPELYPDPQTISFYAASWTMANPETIEVWYSKGSTDIKDFVKVPGAGGEVPEGATSQSDWTYYEAALPEGAKYFAIRSCGADTFMLMVDDVTYRPQRADLGMTLDGYNVYRNGELISDKPVTETSYTDRSGTIGETYEYQVTTLFSGGESRGSKSLKVEFGKNAIEEISSDSTVDNCRLYDLMGREVKQTTPGSIYIRRGKKVLN